MPIFLILMPGPHPQNSDAMVFFKSCSSEHIQPGLQQMEVSPGLLGRCALMDRGFGYREGSRKGDTRRRDQHERGQSGEKMDHEFLTVCWSSWMNPWHHILLWDLHCMSKGQQGGLSLKHLDGGGDVQASFVLLLMPPLKQPGKRTGEGSPSCFCPSAAPCSHPLPHHRTAKYFLGPNKSQMMPYCWDFTSAFSNIAAMRICICDAVEEGQAAGVQGRTLA